MTDVHSKFLERSPRYCNSQRYAPQTRYNREGPIDSLRSWKRKTGIKDGQCEPKVPGEVT